MNKQDALEKLSSIKDQLSFWGQKIQNENVMSRIDELKKKSESENLWDNPDNAKNIMQNLSKLEEMYNSYTVCFKEFTDIEGMIENEYDVLQDMINEELLILEKKTEAWYIDTLFSAESDSFDCYMEFHAGAGGTESQDWASMLFRMYTMYLNKNNYKFSIIDQLFGDEAGIKSAVIKISGSSGSFPYGWLKGESGVHRLVRISPFDSNSRRHTSFASVYVTPVVSNEIKIDIDPKDLRIDTYRSSGAGGQHVNTTDSAVRITHIPTNITVQCQNDRSQHKNKDQAMSMLVSKLYALEQEQQRQRAQEGLAQKQENAWGSQIRSYVLEPYQMIKDNRTGYSETQVLKVLDGDIRHFLVAYLKFSNMQNKSKL
ncbi:MAG: peptide chain release factor 2 [Alphaproteobacteria bacterium]|nr:MAG: peptide chain release factor 2 [Alphaproteobacteria bacterium]